MDLFAVWSPASFAAAAGGGLFLGAFLASFPGTIGATDATLDPHPSAWRRALVALLFMLWLGAIFYTGQIGEALLSSDPGVPRIVSRFGLWVVYSAAVAAGAYLVIWRDLRRTKTP